MNYTFTTIFLNLALSAAPAAADNLIRCPDWKALLEQERTYGLRTSAPSASFETALLVGDARERQSRTSLARPTNSKPLSAMGTTPAIGGTTCAPYVVKKGDTLSKIAKARLGSQKRYVDLARLNGIKVDVPLRIGQVLNIGCHNGSQSAGGKSGADPSLISKRGTAALASEAEAAIARSAKPTAKRAAKATLGPTPKPVPLPVWSAKSGEYLTDVLARWGKAEGYKVINEGSDDWRLGVAVQVRGTFEEAVAQIVRGFEGTGRPPGVSIYSNKVIKVGAP